MEQRLEQINHNILNCQKCLLSQTRNCAVPGDGNPAADIMFIGEAPGANEDLKGVPFCGKAGAILDELLLLVNLKREQIYITNILKCRPPGNRNPATEEIDKCVPYLKAQIEVINPRIICCLGNFAVKFIMERFGFDREIQGISKIHGKKFEYKSLFENRIIVPLYHPAVATYNINMKPVLVKDFRVVKDIIKNSIDNR